KGMLDNVQISRNQGGIGLGTVILQDRAGDNGSLSMPNTLYMVVEQFKNKDAIAVYRRFRDSGRMAPEGLAYVSSWVDDKLERCYQLMETHDRRRSEEHTSELQSRENLVCRLLLEKKKKTKKKSKLT